MSVFKVNPNTQVPSELRERDYEAKTHKEDGSELIPWEGKALTVDQATKLCVAYGIADNPKSEMLKTLIIPARAYIGDLHPEE